MKGICRILLIMVAVSMLMAANAPSVKAAAETIRINADGGVTPSTAPISTTDNITYTLTGNITSDGDGLAVLRNGIIVDGNGYAVTGNGSGNGIALTNSSNVTVRNTTIENFTYGIYLESSFNNTLSGNNVTASNGKGMWLEYSSDNTLSHNSVTANFGNGIDLDSSSNNTLSGNNVAANGWRGISLSYSSDNVLSGNNVAANTLAGIGLDHSSNDVLSDNNVANNGYGIWLQYSSGNTLSGNNAAANDGTGIWIDASDNNTLSSNNATANGWTGIELSSSSGNTLSGNNVANNVKGIELSYDVELGRIGCFSDNNVLSGNNVTANNEEGILLSSSSNNTLSGNNVANNGYGIWIVSISFHPLTKSASGNSIYHNNFINNTPQELIGGGYANTWDDGYPSGGNYWSDYAGVDVKRGLNQNMDGNDGVGDTPYVIDANNTDRYPLMNPCGNPLSAYNLTITVAVGGTTDPAFGNYSYAYGTNVTVTAIPDAGYSLDHWLLDGNNAGNTRSIIVSMTSNHALQPVFARISTPPYLPVSLLLAALLITLVVVILTVKLKRRKKGPPPQTLP